MQILTIKLSAEEKKNLADAMKVTGNKTATGAIRMMIEEFKSNNDFMRLYIKENKFLKDELKLIKDLIKEKQEAKKRVNSLSSKISYQANKKLKKVEIETNKGELI